MSRYTEAQLNQIIRVIEGLNELGLSNTGDISLTLPFIEVFNEDGDLVGYIEHEPDVGWYFAPKESKSD